MDTPSLARQYIDLLKANHGTNLHGLLSRLGTLELDLQYVQPSPAMDAYLTGRIEAIKAAIAAKTPENEALVKKNSARLASYMVEKGKL